MPSEGAKAMVQLLFSRVHCTLPFKSMLFQKTKWLDSGDTHDQTFREFSCQLSIARMNLRI